MCGWLETVLGPAEMEKVCGTPFRSLNWLHRHVRDRHARHAAQWRSFCPLNKAKDGQLNRSLGSLSISHYDIPDPSTSTSSLEEGAPSIPSSPERLPLLPDQETLIRTVFAQLGRPFAATLNARLRPPQPSSSEEQPKPLPVDIFAKGRAMYTRLWLHGAQLPGSPGQSESKHWDLADVKVNLFIQVFR